MITTQKITKVPFVDLSAQYQAIKEEVIQQLQAY
jgi:hypothetical protein